MKGSRSIATHTLPMSVWAGLMRTLSSEGSTYEGTHHRRRLVVVEPVVAVSLTGRNILLPVAWQTGSFVDSH